jgi:LPS export ABC transporter protein LptC
MKWVKPMRQVKFAILLAILLIGGIAGVNLWVNYQARKLLEGEPLPKVSLGDADMQLEKIRLVEDKNGRKSWELEARAIQQFHDQNVITIEDVKVTYYMKEGRSVVISGDPGKFSQDSKNIELVGNVTLTSSDGYRFKTHSIAYDHSKKKVTTADPVELEGDEIRMTGKGMVVDMEGKVIRVLNQVKTTLKRGAKG